MIANQGNRVLSGSTQELPDIHFHALFLPPHARNSCVIRRMAVGIIIYGTALRVDSGNCP